MQGDNSASAMPPSEPDDGFLLARVAHDAHDALDTHDALTMLYQRHGGPILSYLRRFLDDPQTAEEVLQDTFLAIWRNAMNYVGQAPVRVWMLGIARRQAMNRLRRDAASPVFVEVVEDLLDPAADAETLVVAQLDCEELMAALRAIGPLHRDVLGLLLIDHFSYAEMASILNVPIGTIRSRINTARQRLATQLQRRKAQSDVHSS